MIVGMNIVLFGASGMIGQGVLRECLQDPDVKRVLSIVRNPTGQTHEKLRETVHDNFLDFSGIESELSGFDACFFCLGVTSAGMTAEAYERVTYRFTLAAAQMLVKLNPGMTFINPGMTFIYVSGSGTDSTEKGRTMWARVKGRTENALLALPFKAAYMFRPGFIQPLHGIKSKTEVYRIFYVVLGPLFPALRAIFRKSITTTEQLGRAMLAVAKNGYPKKVLESRDITGIVSS